MKLIFWGLVLVFFDFNLNIGACSVSVLPGFVGYWLIRRGMGQVDCDAYIRANPWVIAGIIYSAIVWVLNCIGLLKGSVVEILSIVIEPVIQLVVLHRITKGICELEDTHGWDLYGRSLKTAWLMVAVWTVLSRLMNVLGVASLAVLALLVTYAFVLYYIFRFHKSRRAFEDYEACREEE